MTAAFAAAPPVSPVLVADPGALAAAIRAARDLAWRPTANLPGSIAYHERLEAAARLRDLMAAARLPADPSDALVFLFAAMVRVCVASFSNRRGAPYRGCLAAYDEAGRS